MVEASGKIPLFSYFLTACQPNNPNVSPEIENLRGFLISGNVYSKINRNVWRIIKVEPVFLMTRLYLLGSVCAVSLSLSARMIHLYG